MADCVDCPAPISLNFRFANTNGRRIVAKDTGRFAWITGGRRWRYLRLLKKVGASVITAQEWDETMLKWLQEKMGFAVYKPTAGNRPIVWDPTKWKKIDGDWIDLDRRSFCHAVRLESLREPGVKVWFVSVHLSTDSTVRPRQIKKLGDFVAELPGACVVGGDWNQSTAALPGFRNATDGAKVINRKANSLHGWRPQRFDGKWIDHILLRDVDSYYVELVLTSENDESDHSLQKAGLTGFKAPEVSPL